MKTLLSVIAGFISLTATARDLVCTIDPAAHSLYMAKEFRITNIDKKFPGITNFDGGNLGIDGNRLAYSNECENWMEVLFADGAYDSILNGKRTEISGVVRYNHTELGFGEGNYNGTYPGSVKLGYDPDEYVILLPVRCVIDPTDIDYGDDN